jgi:GntR family transcriptional regulator / MocR family aminotransferase
LDVHISLIGRHGLASEIYRQLRAAIVDGHLAGGDALPPTRELAQRLGVSRSTVTFAYDQLIGEGYASARGGSGTFVSGHFRPGPPPRAARHAALQPRPIWESHPLPPDLALA